MSTLLVAMALAFLLQRTLVRAGITEFNATLGTYTNFVNFFDLCAISIPSGHYQNGVPIGITLIAPAFGDATLAGFARRVAELALR